MGLFDMFSSPEKKRDKNNQLLVNNMARSLERMDASMLGALSNVWGQVNYKPRHVLSACSICFPLGVLHAFSSRGGIPKDDFSDHEQRLLKYCFLEMPAQHYGRMNEKTILACEMAKTEYYGIRDKVLPDLADAIHTEIEAADKPSMASALTELTYKMTDRRLSRNEADTVGRLIFDDFLQTIKSTMIAMDRLYKK